MCPEDFGMRKRYFPVLRLLGKLVEKFKEKAAKLGPASPALPLGSNVTISEPQLDFVHRELAGLLQKAKRTARDQDRGMKGKLRNSVVLLYRNIRVCSMSFNFSEPEATCFIHKEWNIFLSLHLHVK